MNKVKNKSLTGFSQNLRSNMTKEEAHLWYDFLKKLPLTFNRQKVIGCYIVDFYCSSANLVIELDGAQHLEEEAKKKDEERDKYLSQQGLTVLRYSNYNIANSFDLVCNDILEHLPGLC